MPKSRLTRGKLLAAAAPLAAAPIVGKLALDGRRAAVHDHSSHNHSRSLATHERRRDGSRRDDRRRGARRRRADTISTRCSTRPRALPYRPGRVREYTLTATDVDLEVAPGVFFPAWVYNGTAPGPVIRATEGDRLRVQFRQRRLASAHDPLPRHPPDEHGRRLRDRRAGWPLHVRVRGAAGGLPPVPLPRDAAEEAHPQGPLRRVHHRPEGAAPARAGARHGDERLRHRRATAGTTSTPSTGARSTTRSTRSG